MHATAAAAFVDGDFDNTIYSAHSFNVGNGDFIDNIFYVLIILI